MKDLKNVLETRMKKKRKVKDSPKKNETALYVNVEDEHSVPDCVKQIELKIVADKGTQTEKVIRQIYTLQAGT